MEATTPAYPTRLSDAQWATLAVYVVVTAANIADRQGLPPLLRRLQFRRGWFRRLRLI